MSKLGHGPASQSASGSAVSCEDLDAEWLRAQPGACVGCSHRIVRHLASGGMGHVFLTEHVYLGARAAVKVPRFATVHARKTLEAEAQLLSKLDHPNIVRAIDFGQLADARPYLLMEYARGIELDGWLDARGPMESARALGVLRQIASALDYLHARGVVHGDIKPSNVLIDVAVGDFVKLVDFGIAFRAGGSERRGPMGTPAYMAPEQAAGEVWGAASDVYGVAALAMELLTGRPPHDGRTAQDAMTAVLSRPAPKPSARGLDVPGLDAVFERGLHAEPARRYSSAGELVCALEAVLMRERAAQVHEAAAAADPRLSSERGPRRRPPWGPSAAALQAPSGERAIRRFAACVVVATYLLSVYF